MRSHRSARHLRVVTSGSYEWAFCDEAKDELSRFARSEPEELRRWLWVIMDQARLGKLEPDLDVKRVHRQPDVLEIVVDWRGRRFRLYYAEPPTSKTMLLLLMLAEKPGGQAGLQVQDQHMDEAARRYLSWLRKQPQPE